MKIRFKKCMNYEVKIIVPYIASQNLKVNSVISYGDQLNNDQWNNEQFKCV